MSRVSLRGVLGDNGDHLLVVERLWGRGRENGAEVEKTIYSAYTGEGMGGLRGALARCVRQV